MVEGKFLPRLIGPRPFAGRVAEAQHRVILVRFLDLPRAQPPLSVQRTGISRHVWSQLNLPSAEAESAAADSVHVGHKRETGGLENSFRRAVAFTQYRHFAISPNPIERRNTPANRGT